MRLLDGVARCDVPLVLPGREPSAPCPVAGPNRFAALVAACPLRFVLGDDLARASAELAFADGARLVGCMDLLRMPAQNFWLEWNDEVHKRVIHENNYGEPFDAAATGRKAGSLLRASPDGLTAIGRTFWANSAVDDSAEIILSPLETYFDLRGEFEDSGSVKDVLNGGFVDATHDGNPPLASLLGYVRFKFDDSWAGYYRAAAADPQFKYRLITESIRSIAWDAPLILAFLLLLSAKDATRTAPVSRAAINRKRIANGRRPLLDHLEVNACLDALLPGALNEEESGRRSPRLHHVRGHLVRHNDRVFWRRPHLRGSGTRGIVRSRTVCLSFARKTAQDARTQA